MARGCCLAAASAQFRDPRRDKRLRRWQWDRYGYVSPEIHGPPHMIVRNAEVALGPTHDPTRMQGWLDEYAGVHPA